MNKSPITTLEDLNVENVFIYVGDAVRWDFTPPQLKNKGITLKTVAASTHSPSSFASIVTGLYAPIHGVSMFSHQISKDQDVIFDLREESCFVNSIFAFADREHGESVDPIYSVLNRDPPSDNIEITDLSEPFIFMERGPGGHAPYGDYDGTATEYFRNASDKQTVRSDYGRSISLDMTIFENRLAEIDEAGLKDNTLIIYTSDHGELLGEGGMLGHSSPMRPELVYVPTTFIHPDLPSYIIDDKSFHHADILPTLSEIFERNYSQKHSDGIPLNTNVENTPRPSFYQNQSPLGKLPFISGSLHYEGAWDATGGYVFGRTPLMERMMILSTKLLRSSKQSFMQKQLGQLVTSYILSSFEYGTPLFSQEEAKEVISQSISQPQETTHIELSDSAEQQLRDLGYR